MKLTRIAASMIALTLFAGPVLAQGNGGNMVVAAANIVPPAVQMILTDQRPLSSLSVEQLQKRIRQAQHFAQLPGLPPDVVASLNKTAADSKAELAARQANATGSDAGNGGGNGTNGGNNGSAGGGNEPAQKLPPIATQIPDDVLAYASDHRPSAGLDAGALNGRIGTAKKILAMQSLPPKIRANVQARLAADQAEFTRRKTAAAANTQQAGGNGGAITGVTPEPGDDPASGNVKNATGGNAGGGLLIKVTRYLNETRSPSTMPVDKLKSAIADGNQLLDRPNLPVQVKTQVMNTQTSLNNALQQKLAGNGGSNQAGNGWQLKVDRLVLDATSPHALPQNRLLGDIAAGDNLMQGQNLDPGSKQGVYAALQSLRAELQLRKSAGNGGNTTTNNGGNKTGNTTGNAGNGGNGNNNPPAVSQADEAQARMILGDSRNAKTMDLQQLRQRLNAIRSLLQQRQISPGTSTQLRAKLDADRLVLRDRMAQVTGNNGGNNNGGNNNGGNNNAGNNNGGNNNAGNNNGGVSNVAPGGQVSGNNVDRVRNDRRPPQDLNDDELRFRINIFVNVLGSNMYPNERYDWQRRLDMDRQQLRVRMLEERAQREASLREEQNRIILDQQQAQYNDLAAAEANDQELQDTLSAAPRRKFDRRYSIDDLENNSDVRAALPRIEIDTIHFGFNESFVREEEVSSLDRVARVMERILASNPDEIFLIEGHTDASGSDYYNLGLSRQRASAVVQALTTYYVIPARNLRTVGYGERYLKIPVDGPEAENRRVSVSRITDVVSQY